MLVSSGSLGCLQHDSGTTREVYMQGQSISIGLQVKVQTKLRKIVYDS